MKKIFIIFFIIIIPDYLFPQSDSIIAITTDWEVFPIINYDSDVGFGYGGKGFIYNILNSKESFDLILYNSTKGERWYRFVFSIPDIQRRQGKTYTLAFDLVADYDKWINYKYYSSYKDPITGNNIDQVEDYKREVTEFGATFSTGIVEKFVGELGIKLKIINGFNFHPDEDFNRIFQTYVKVLSLNFNLRWDTRTNFINPKNGFVIEIDNELAKDLLTQSSQNYYRFAFIEQSYITLIKPNFVIANRTILQSISDVGYLLLLPIGGNNTVRGLPQDRYLSTSTVVVNSELRFPIWWRLGGIAGFDAGNSKTTPYWIINPVVGLRFFMDNFIVRFDVGFGKESTSVYFNFGNIF